MHRKIIKTRFSAIMQQYAKIWIFQQDNECPHVVE